MVGDNLETDILFGQNSGVSTMLVMTGEKAAEGQRVLMILCQRQRQLPSPHLQVSLTNHHSRPAPPNPIISWNRSVISPCWQTSHRMVKGGNARIETYIQMQGI
jgi:hypothetical protein